MIAGLKKWFQDKIGIGENRDKIIYLEKRIKLNQALLQLTLPNYLNLDVEKRDVPFIQEFGAGAFNLTIHKNDLMFLAILLAKDGRIDPSLEEYFRVGYDTVQSLKARCGNLEPKHILDFGGGYGRVSRFLKSAFPKAEIHVSEIKSEAVEFNKTALGLGGLAHTNLPESLISDFQFDLIFAGSVFTHLPKKDAYNWLQKLAQLLSKNGILIFSIHNSASFGMENSEGFAYKTLSEDEFFNVIDDSIQDNSTYGTAYFSSQLIKQWLSEFGLTCTIEANAFGGIQDLVIARYSA